VDELLDVGNSEGAPQAVGLTAGAIMLIFATYVVFQRPEVRA